MAEKGQLSINSENMFPIIKKWLYSDHDIFYRELISNGCDAITKLKKLDMMGETSLPADYKPRIDVVLDPEEKTVEVSDNGLGMTADEVKKYINDIAFSGAEAFLNKYKDKANNDQIIGHFGLGFYSAFMVSDLVTIDTLSYQKDARGVHWECDGSSEYSMDDSDRKEVGTTVTLHLSDDCVEFANYYKAKEVIQKYCGFMPVEIYLSVKNTKETETIPESERRPDDIVIEEIQPTDEEKKQAEKDKKEPEKKLKIRKRPELVNDTHPLWEKNPKDCTDEDYKEFYRKLFNDYKEPLFWIHLNMDYPYNLKGILYFPKINLEYESAEGVIKLYNNQVFIADNIKEVIPEYLMVLKGVIDCPDLPLNVSRSALQNDGFAQKISDYITKKVAEKLSGMCKTDRDNYNKYWDDISPFIKYGVLKDDKFAEKMRDYILFKDLDGNYVTLPDALKINAEAEKEQEAADRKSEATDENGNKVEAEEIKPGDNSKEAGSDSAAESSTDSAKDEKDGKTADSSKDEKKEEKNETIYYVTDVQQQSQYIKVFREHKMQAFIMDRNIDAPFIQRLEMKNEGIHFVRIDAGVDDVLKKKSTKKDEEAIKKAQPQLEKIVRRALKDDKLKVSLDSFKDKKISAILKVDEDNRRMQDMMKMYADNGMGYMGDFGKEGETLVLNYQHPLVQYILGHKHTKNTKLICEQLYDVAKIQNAPLDADEMSKFVDRTNEVLGILAGQTTDEDDPDMAEPAKEEKKEEKEEKKEDGADGTKE